MARLDPQIAAHLEWIGFVRPTGLVVSAPALVKAGALLNRRDAEGQQLLLGCVEEHERDRAASGVLGIADSASEPEPQLPDFRAFASSVLGWNFSPAGYAGTDEAPLLAARAVPGRSANASIRPLSPTAPSTGFCDIRPGAACAASPTLVTFLPRGVMHDSALDVLGPRSYRSSSKERIGARPRGRYRSRRCGAAHRQREEFLG